ncbi:uncharacterized protein LOC144713292 [Wolffia australiana]
MHSISRGAMPIQPEVILKKPFPSRPLSQMPLPSSREIHWWYVIPDEVQSPLLTNHCLETLSPDEKDKAMRMKEPKLQKGALLSRLLLRTTLARYTNSMASPESLKFLINRFGKPEVQWPCDGSWTPPPLHFNVSHTSSLIACAVTTNSPIGIDVIEKHRQLKNNIISFARRYFAPTELEYLSGISDLEARRQEFLRLWALKEAYVKALGRGFSGAPFKYFAIRFKQRAKERSTDPDSNAFELIIQPDGKAEELSDDWQLGLFELASSHHAAICLKKAAEDYLTLKIWKVMPSFSEILVPGTEQVLDFRH